MASLRDAVFKAAPARHQFRRLIQAIEPNLGLESAEDMSHDEVLDILENLFDMIPDFRSQMELHREVPRVAAQLPGHHQQTQAHGRQR